jgi:flagella basal body P-ring formation protein FlgA
MAFTLLFFYRRQTNVEVKRAVSMWAHLVVVATAVTMTASAQASTQSLSEVQKAAEAFVLSRLPEGNAKHFVAAAPLDPRLRLTPCAEPLEAFSSHTGNLTPRMTVGVRCTAPASWTVYVPVTIETEVPVLVLRHALARRARVTLADVEPQVRRLPGTASMFVTDIASLQGHHLKRALPAGSALTVDALAPDILVRRGQQVTLIAETGGVQIRAQGQALSDGAARDRIRVQNVTSLKIVEGVVESDSVVRVGS